MILLLLYYFLLLKIKKFILVGCGDGAIVVFGKNSLILEENKNTFTNYTFPFGREKKIQWYIFDESEIDSIVICSDGVSEDLKKDMLLDFFQNYIDNYKDMQPNRRAYQIKKWLRNWPVRGHSDDKTIVALVKV